MLLIVIALHTMDYSAVFSVIEGLVRFQYGVALHLRLSQYCAEKPANF